MVKGSDPVLKNEYVVISAHLDHIGLTGRDSSRRQHQQRRRRRWLRFYGLIGHRARLHQGAAKGIRPKRSIIFLWNAGEEKGLWGSQYFAEFPPVDIKKIVADLNIE